MSALTKAKWVVVPGTAVKGSIPAEWRVIRVQDGRTEVAPNVVPMMSRADAKRVADALNAQPERAPAHRLRH